MFIASNEAPFILLGKVIIDATGDAIVSTLAGATVFKGREDGLMQPVTLEFTIEGVDESRGLICIGDVDDVQLFGKRFLDWCREQADAGKIPPSLAAVRLHPTVHPGERQVNTTQVCGVDITQVDQIFPADLQLRRQMVLPETFLRENVPGYEKARIIASGTTTGVRESRRVLGDYLIDASELSAGCRFPDVVVHNALFIVDIHNPAGAGQAEDHIQYCKPYDLPYRCFLPKGLEGLLVTGRSISGTHRAHASYRVMSICMAMGEATGMAAALAAARGCTPRELPVSDLQSAMTARGIRLFDIWNRIVAMQIEFLDVARAYRRAKDGGTEHQALEARDEFRARWNEIARLRNQIRPFVSKDNLLFTVSNAFDNLHMLGLSYILNAQDQMPHLIFLIEIMNTYIDKVTDCFYNIDAAKQVYYNAADSSRLLDLARQTNFNYSQSDLDDSLFDRDCDPSAPLELGFDWGSSICLMIVDQERHWDFAKGTASQQVCQTQINEFFVKPEGLAHGIPHREDPAHARAAAPQDRFAFFVAGKVCCV